MSRLGRITAATIAGCTLLLTTAGPSLADATTAVGVGASAYVDDYSVDVLIEQAIENALFAGGFQEVGAFVNVSHGNVILSGFMSPQLHLAVQELVADTLGGLPLPLPFAVAVLIPTGLALPDLGLALDVVLPDLTAPLTTLGVTDRILSY
ncbi:MAG: hypothetical protein QOG43_3631 [Actinomycetota bacterium]|nr:hypothetical protein [Actinomycetota bacterium]